jgi:hypothetical protein
VKVIAMVRTDYRKAVIAGTRYFETDYKADRFWTKMQELLEWIANIPTPKDILSRARQKENIHYKILENVGKVIAKDLESLGRKVYPERFRPVYVTIVEKLPEAIFKGLSMREFAERLGISWRTVRDCFWFMRRIGFELPTIDKIPRPPLPYR